MRIRTLALQAMLILLAMPAIAQQTPADRARAEQAAGMYSVAATHWLHVLQTQPDNPEALLAVATCLEPLGRWREAVPHLKRLIALEPNNAQAAYQLGRFTSWQGSAQRSSALALLEHATELAPANPDFREGYAEVLSWSNQSTKAIELLHANVRNNPEHAPSRRLLARLLAAQSKREQAMTTLQPLLDKPAPAADDLAVLGQIEQSSGKQEQAIAAYRAALARDPSHLEALTRLAEILSWKQATRQEALQLYEHGLQLHPKNEALLVPYALVLSWNPNTKQKAAQYLEEVLTQNPENLRAKGVLAQICAYSGKPQRARELYDEVLKEDPDDVPALRGKAEMLNWSGDYSGAMELLDRAHNHWPDDPMTLVEIARANSGLRRYAQAQSALGQLSGMSGPYFDELRRDVSRGLGTYLEIGYMFRHPRTLGLGWHRMEAIVSTPLGQSNRLSASFRPTLYQTNPRDFNSNYYAIAIDSQLSERVTTHAEFGAETYPGVQEQFDAAFEMRFRLNSAFSWETAFHRQAVEDSLPSILGVQSAGAYRGQVHSNMASVRGTYTNASHRYDLSFGYSDGVYTGRGLDSNRRWDVDATFGKTLRGYQPYVRAGYGFLALNFQFDAFNPPGAGPPRRSAQYFSPEHFLLNYGWVSVSHKFGSKVNWDSYANVGVQHVKSNPFSSWDARLAYNLTTNLVWHINDSNDIRLGYSFQDTFNAFRQHIFRVSWRHYF